MDDPYIDNTTERSMNEQTRKALELAREALTGCTDSLEYVNRLALGAVDFDVRYERISIAGKAIAAIDAALSAPAAPVAQPLPDADVLMRVVQRLNANPYSLTKSECIFEIEAMRAHGIGQGGA